MPSSAWPEPTVPPTTWLASWLLIHPIVLTCASAWTPISPGLDPKNVILNASNAFPVFTFPTTPSLMTSGIHPTFAWCPVTVYVYGNSTSESPNGLGALSPFFTSFTWIAWTGTPCPVLPVKESRDQYYLQVHPNLPSLAIHSPLHMRDNKFDIY